MKRAVRWYDYITINIYYLGATTLVAQTTGILTPLLVQKFVGEAGKGAFFGTLRLWSLMAALLVQAAMGMLSDRSSVRWGRRRPFIFVGTLFNLVFVAAIGFSIDLEGMAGYWVLFVLTILLAVSANVAISGQQGLIPDLVPENLRGRFSGVKAVLELPVPLLFVAFTVAKLIADGNLWGGILVAMSVMFLSTLVTMFVPEEALEDTPPPLDWTPFLRLVFMTGLFTVIILGMGKMVTITGGWVHSIDSPTILLIVMGFIGLVAIVVAVVMGTWISIRISLGSAANQRRSFTWWVVNRLAFLVGATNLSSFAIYYLQARLGYVEEKAAQPASILLLLVGVFILVAALPSGWLADRFGHKRLVAISGFVAALGTLIAIIFPSLTLLYIGGCFLGAATGVFFTANWALGTTLVPKGEAGRFLGLSNLAGAGAGAVGAYIGGPIADYFTMQVPEIPGLGYVLLFVIYGTMFLISVLAITRVEYRQAAHI